MCVLYEPMSPILSSVALNTLVPLNENAITRLMDAGLKYELPYTTYSSCLSSATTISSQM